MPLANSRFLVYLDTDVNSQHEIKLNLGYILGLQIFPSPKYPCLHIHLLEMQTAWWWQPLQLLSWKKSVQKNMGNTLIKRWYWSSISITKPYINKRGTVFFQRLFSSFGFATSLALGEKKKKNSYSPAYLFSEFGFCFTQSWMSVLDQIQFFYHFYLELKAQCNERRKK